MKSFVAVAALIMAHQVAGKAVRDGLFLSQFPAGDLPKIMGAAALFSVALGVAFARRMSIRGPMRVVPAAFAIGGLLHWVEFALLRSPGVVARGVIVTTIYLHLVGLGAVLLSGFWSVASEVFDPRTAKRHFGRITGAGTAGGIGGGLIAERMAAMVGVDALLIVLGALHIAAWWVLRGVPAPAGQTVTEEPAPLWRTARTAFRHSPFLANLAVLVLLGTVSAALLDYVFKSGAAAAYGRGPQLTRYFAIFYTSAQLLTFGAQAFLTPLSLRRLGLGRTLQWHPMAVGLGAAASMFLPAIVMGPAARALELIFRGSFLRSSYELFFTPSPPRERRATKTFIDVACDRMGDALGAALLQALLMFGPRQIVMPILGLTAAIAATSLWIARRMDTAYSRALEHGLLSRSPRKLDPEDLEDSSTLSVILRPATTAIFSKPNAAPEPAPVTAAHDPMLARLADLRSGSQERVKAALAPDQPYDPAIVPFAVRLLAWDSGVEWARAFLLRHAHRAIGQLTDGLLDADEDFAVRRRIPQILAYASSQRAVDGLTAALPDPRFEIRFHCSRALEFLHRMGGDLRFDRQTLLGAVEAEMSSSRTIWEGRKLLDRQEPSDSQYWFLDEVLRERANKSLEHVFSLLAVVLPAEPLKVAFRALHGDDRMMRGLALEFLEIHLSRDLVSRMRKLLDPAPVTEVPRAPEQVMTELMTSHDSILAKVKNAYAGAPATGG